MRGYDVTSRSSWGNDDTMRTFKGLLSVFEKPIEIRWRNKKIADVIEAVADTVKYWGEGARAFIGFDWKGLPEGQSDGHIIVAECGAKGAIPDSIRIMRVDTLKFTNEVKRCCMNWGEGK